MNRGSVNVSVGYARCGMCTKGYNLPNSKVDKCVQLDTVIPRHMSHTREYVPQQLTALGEGFDCAFQSSGVELGVYLGRGDMFMAECLLDQSYIAGLVVEPGGKGMPKGVGRNVFGDSGFNTSSPNDPLDLPGGQAIAVGIPEERVSRKCPSCQRPKGIKDGSVNRDAIRISALGMEKRDCPSVPGHIIYVERDSFTQAAAGRQHEGQQGSVTFGPLASEVEGQKNLDFNFSENFRRQRPMSFASKDGGGVASDQPPCFPPSEQGLQADPVAVDGGLGPLRSTQANLDAVGGHETDKQVRGHGVEFQFSGKRNEGIEVTPVCGHGVVRPPLVCEVDQELGNGLSDSHGALLSGCEWSLGDFHSCSIGEPYQVIYDIHQTIYAGEDLAIGGR